MPTQITQLPTPPSTTRPVTFATESDTFLAALPQFVSDANAMAVAMTTANTQGAAAAISYTFSTTTTDADPGNGVLRLDNATQNLATTIRADLLGLEGTDWTNVLNTFTASTSGIKGQIRLVKRNDESKWILFNVTALASPAGYKNITVAVVGSSTASPFANGDTVSLIFTRTGDIGANGSILRRVTSIASSATPTPNAATDDLYSITALAVAATLGAPTGTPSDGQGLMLRIKDNGTSQTLAYNVIYRAGTDSTLPAATVAGKTMYLGFIYNAPAAKWDLIAVMNNI